MHIARAPNGILYIVGVRGAIGCSTSPQALYSLADDSYEQLKFTTILNTEKTDALIKTIFKTLEDTLDG